ncbi:MAG: 50S ribosomal protein L25 [Deltaproteobacteria bacterium]|nr:50S ribosomal protein L25 [Deltaproteobacteria bacterium]
MSEQTIINATVRNEKGKIFSKKIKKDGLIPAVVYGHNYAPVSLCLDDRQMNRMFRPGGGGSDKYQVIKLVIKNGDDTNETMVVTKEIQRHPLKDNIQHIDFFAVNMDEEITTPVHIRVHGKSEGVKLGGIQRQILREVDVRGLPADIPPHLDIDVTELQIGDAVHVSDLVIPDNVKILNDAQAAIVSILVPTLKAEDEEETEETEEAAEGEQAEETDASSES